MEVNKRYREGARNMLGVTRISTFFFFSSRRRHTRYWRDWSSDVCSSDLKRKGRGEVRREGERGKDVGREEGREGQILKNCHKIGRASCRERV